MRPIGNRAIYVPTTTLTHAVLRENLTILENTLTKDSLLAIEIYEKSCYKVC